MDCLSRDILFIDDTCMIERGLYTDDKFDNYEDLADSFFKAWLDLLTG